MKQSVGHICCRMNLDPFGKISEDSLWRALELAQLKVFVTKLPGGKTVEQVESSLRMQWILFLNQITDPEILFFELNVVSCVVKTSITAFIINCYLISDSCCREKKEISVS